MKKFLYVFFNLIFLAILLPSCNKDDSVSSNNGNTNTGPTTKTFSTSPNKNIIPGLTEDVLSVNITNGINAYNVKDIKLNLESLTTVSFRNLCFKLLHNGAEVLVIDSLTNITGTGDVTNLILSDSETVSIMTVSSYPITGKYKPVNPLSGFDNMEVSGNWTLRIYNSGSFRTGVIKSWGITVSYNAISQIPTITKDYLPTLGNIHKFKLCDTTNISPGNGGENVVWDFTNINAQPFEYSNEYISAQNSTWRWHFPQSNLAIRNIDLNQNSLDFIRSMPDSDSLKFFGYVDSIANDVKIMQYTPYVVSFKRNPITYNYISVDSGLSYYSEPGITRNGKFMDTVLADGWGTIKLPGGATYNVLRIINDIAGIDTTNGSTISYTLNRIYSWYVSGYKFPVFRIQVFYRYSPTLGNYYYKEVRYTTQNVSANK